MTKNYAKVFKPTLKIEEITSGEASPELPPEELQNFQIIEVSAEAEVGQDVRLHAGTGDPPPTTPEPYPPDGYVPAEPPVTQAASAEEPGTY